MFLDIIEVLSHFSSSLCYRMGVLLLPVRYYFLLPHFLLVSPVYAWVTDPILKRSVVTTSFEILEALHHPDVTARNGMEKEPNRI